MKELDGLIVMGVDVGADRMECCIAVQLGQRCVPFSLTRLVVESTPGRADPLGRSWINPILEWAYPPVGTPSPKTQGGNSTPAHAPVAVFQQSPVLSPVSGV